MNKLTNRRRWAVTAATAATVIAGVAAELPAGASTAYPTANGCYLVEGGTVDFASVARHQTQLSTPTQIFLQGTSASTYADPALAPYVATGTTDCAGYTYTLTVRTATGGPIDYLASSSTYTGAGAATVTSPAANEVDVAWTKTSSNSWSYDSFGNPAFNATMNFGKKNTDTCLSVQFKVTDAAGNLVDAAPSSGPGQACGGNQGGGLTMQG